MNTEKQELKNRSLVMAIIAMWLFVSVWVFVLSYYATIDYKFSIATQMVFQVAVCGIALFSQEKQYKRYKYD